MSVKLDFIPLWVIFEYIQNNGYCEFEKDNICQIWVRDEIYLIIDMLGECMEKDEAIDLIESGGMNTGDFILFVSTQIRVE